jgi:hypothetical protein
VPKKRISVQLRGHERLNGRIKGISLALYAIEPIAKEFAVKEALIIFIVGLILGSNFAHGTTAREVNELIAQGESLVRVTNQSVPTGWDNMNLQAEIENVQDELNAALPSAPAAKRSAIERELKRLEAALHLLESQG